MPQPSFGGDPSQGGGTNQMAMASLVCGGVSIASSICCCVPLISIVAVFVVPTLGLAAIVTGVLGLQAANKMGGTGKTESIVGIVLGSFGVAAGLISVVMLIVYGGLMLAGSQPSY